jgi:hypothetical protein
LSTPTPHDGLFRYIFSQPENAAPLIRSLVPAAAGKVDWTSLQLEPGSYVDERLRARHSDLLFQARVDGRTTFLYVLMEHQSTVDALMPWRVLQYIVRVCERWLDENHVVERLPAVIPIVVYHGQRRWKAARDLHALIDLDAAMKGLLGPHIPQLEIVLDDLSGQDETALRRKKLTNAGFLALWALQVGDRSRSLEREIVGVIDVVAELAASEHGQRAWAAVLQYSLETAEVDAERLRAVLENNIGKPKTETLMTGAERLRAEGEARGEARGQLLGQRQGKADLLLKLLRTKFGEVSASVQGRVETATADELDAMSGRLFRAVAPEDVLNDDSTTESR